jgi:hypothetical protein
MTYITPDDIALQRDNDRYWAHLKLSARTVPSDPAFPPWLPGTIAAAPNLPYPVNQYTLPTRNRAPPAASTTSPLQTDQRDMGPGGFIPLP